MKKIIIIGGGFSGSWLARKLEKKFQVTLIDTKDYFEFTPSILRTIVEPNHLNKIQSLHQNYLKKTTILKDKVKTVTKKEVIMSKQKISFDYLVICSGSRYNSLIKQENVVLAYRGETLKKYSEKVSSSKKILIIGGGLVGIELAAEIKEKHSDKEIIIVQSQKTCIPRCNQKAINYTHEYLNKKKIEIIFGEKVINNKQNTFFTDKQTKINADLAFFCTGITPNSEFLTKNFPKYLDSRKFIITNSNLQLNKNIFVAGDVTAIKEEKTAQNAEKQAEIVYQNIINLEKNKPLTNYTSKPRMMLISLGKHKGILTYKNFTWTGIIPAILKNFVEWKEMFKLK